MGWLSKTTEKPEDANTASTTDAGNYEVPSDDFLRDIARLKGHAPVQAEKADASVLYPISAAIAKEEREKEATRLKAETESLKNLHPGQAVAGQGIFLGRYQPRDGDGNSLGKIFNVFAAPQDLTDTSGKKETYTYVDTVKRVAELKSWNGFDGTNYATDKEIYKALKDGSYNGGWVIPPRVLLMGSRGFGSDATQPDNLFRHQNTGSFKDTFTTAMGGAPNYPDCYWSSTECNDYMGSIRFSNGDQLGYHDNYYRQSCRPVRLVATEDPAKWASRRFFSHKAPL